jgi:hypothetical protein
MTGPISTEKIDDVMIAFEQGLPVRLDDFVTGGKVQVAGETKGPNYPITVKRSQDYLTTFFGDLEMVGNVGTWFYDPKRRELRPIGGRITEVRENPTTHRRDVTDSSSNRVVIVGRLDSRLKIYYK